MSEQLPTIQEANEVGLISRIGSQITEFAGNHLPKLPPAATAFLATVALAGGPAEQVASASSESHSAPQTPERTMSFAKCARMATHLRPESIKSKFIVKNGTAGQFVEVDGITNNTDGCAGTYTWKAKVMKEDEDGYYGASPKVKIARGSTQQEVHQIIKTKGKNLWCDGGAGAPTFDAYQKNYLSYKDGNRSKKRKVNTKIVPVNKYC